MAKALRLHKLRKTYDQHPAVNDLNLNVNAGEFVTLLGPSGCGKTTSLKLIAGLLSSDHGEIFFGDKEVSKLPPEKRNVGLVFQQYALFPHMRVADNIAFGLKMRGVSKSERLKRVSAMLEIIELAEYGSRFPKELSGGQQQRVALARTLVTEPDILLLDEPLSNLDSRLREDLRGFIRTLQKRLNITTIFVTHDQQEALELSDRIAVMLAGQLVQVGKPEDIYETPQSEALARFTGACNFIPLTSLEGKRAKTALGPLQLANGCGRLGEFVMIRPEHIQLGPRNENSRHSNHLKARISNLRYRGHSTLADLEINTMKLCVQSNRKNLQAGEEVTAYLPPEHLWIIPSAKPEQSIKETETYANT